MNRVSRKKNDNFTVVSNVFLRDKELSIKAKGFLAVVMGLPDNWDFTINGICQALKEGKTAIYNVINELKEKGYCKTETSRNEKGMILGVDYSFFEEPNIDIQAIDYPYTENLNMDNQPQLNTYINKDLNIKNEIIKEDTNVSKKEPIDFDFIKSEWERINPNLSTIRSFSDKRKKSVRTLLKNNNACIDDLIKCFEIIAICSFCNGNNSQKWEATIDWVINDTKSCFNRLLEGAYAKNDYERRECERISNGDISSSSTTASTATGLKFQFL